MSEQRVTSPTEIPEQGWRGRVLGVTRIGGRAGYAAAAVLALLTVLIIYGVSTAGHHRALQAMDGPPLTKASEQHEAWWESIADTSASPPPPLPPPARLRATPPPRMAEVEEPVVRERVPELAPPPASFAGAGQEPQRSEREIVEERRRALSDEARSAAVTVHLEDAGGVSGDGARRAGGDAASAPIVPALLAGMGSGGGSGGTSESDGPDERLGFLVQAASPSRDRLPSQRRAAPAGLALRAGSVIPAILLTGINADLPGTLIAQVREDVYDSVTGRSLLIPAGAKLTGTYDSHVVQGQKRVLVVWRRLLYPDGSDLDLLGMAGVDPAGAAGFAATADEHLGKQLASATLLSLISAGTQLSQPQRTILIGAPPDVGQTIAGAIGQQIAEESLQRAQQAMQAAPTLTVEAGYRFSVLVDRDLVLPAPYGDAGSAP